MAVVVGGGGGGDVGIGGGGGNGGGDVLVVFGFSRLSVLPNDVRHTQCLPCPC